jgi:hypothetical protein
MQEAIKHDDVSAQNQLPVSALARKKGRRKHSSTSQEANLLSAWTHVHPIFLQASYK